jgi:hypothetical protein
METPLSSISRALPQTLKPLLSVHREYPDLLNSLIGRLLAKIFPLSPARFLEELDQYELAARLLDEPVLAQALSKLEADHRYGNLIGKLLHTASQRSWYETTGVAKHRPDDLPALSRWLQLADFAFNPFGPEQAASDPLLPDFAVDFVVERVRGARPVLMWGKPGVGLTATAFLLAHYCYDPFTNPREPETFPVYYMLPSGISPFVDRRWCLASLARAISRALTDYLTSVPEGFLDLSPSRQERLGRLLLTCAGGSRRQLQRQLRESSRVGANRSLVTLIETLDPEIHISGGLDEQDWLDLLRDALPSSFSRLYFLIDVSTIVGDTNTSAKWIHTLIGLAPPLQAIGLYLKVFVSEELHSHLAESTDIDHVQLSWTADNLRLMLRERIRVASRESSVAGRDSLDALCDPGARNMEVDESLVKAATTPRDVVHLGNRLLQIHAERDPNNPQLTEKDVNRWRTELE